MTLDGMTTSRLARRFSLFLLRVTAGFLLVFWGLEKIVSGTPTIFIWRNTDLGEATNTAIASVTGGAQFLIGICCVIGLWRKVVLPLQTLINGVTAAGVWWAIVDPFRWYIEDVDRIVFNSHIYYPTSITFAACLLLICFRREDAWSVDALRSRQA